MGSLTQAPVLTRQSIMSERGRSRIRFALRSFDSCRQWRCNPHCCHTKESYDNQTSLLDGAAALPLVAAHCSCNLDRSCCRVALPRRRHPWTAIEATIYFGPDELLSGRDAAKMVRDGQVIPLHDRPRVQLTVAESFARSVRQRRN